MEKAKLKVLRTRFREGVFERDRHRCVVIGCRQPAVDAHHITDRTLMPNDGYTIENGISLCAVHHYMAEQFHVSAGAWWFKGFHPDDLYSAVGSSYAVALAACERLG